MNTIVIIFGVSIIPAKPQLFVCGALVVVFLLGSTSVLWWAFRSTVPEPEYQGIGLSVWVDGTMVKRTNAIEMARVLHTVGPEALPWLVEAAERRGSFKNSLYLRYVKLYRNNSLVRR